MRAWNRWQDWASCALGVILFIGALVYGTAMPAAEYTGLVIGVLLFVVGLLLLGNPLAVWGEWVQVILGVLLFISSWVFGYQALAPTNWFAWIVGVLTVIAAGWVLLDHSGERASPGARPS